MKSVELHFCCCWNWILLQFVKHIGYSQEQITAMTPSHKVQKESLLSRTLEIGQRRIIGVSHDVTSWLDYAEDERVKCVRC